MLFRWLINWLRDRNRNGPAGSPEPPREASIQVGARAMELELSNVVAVARREYVSRARTRVFKLTTALLVVAALVLALAPVLIRLVGQSTSVDTVELSLGDSNPSIDVAAALNGLLNAPSGGSASTGGSGGSGGSTTGGTGSGTTGTPQYRVTTTTDIAAARARVDAGTSVGLLIVTRTASDGDLAFTFVTKARAIDRVFQLVQGAVSAIAVEDRLAQAGINPVDQAKLFAPPSYTAELPSGGAAGSDTAEAFVDKLAIGFILSIVLFMAIILYGQWVAYSVAEEKSSRVMEVILGAASPFELLAGKVVGVGGLALTQYAIIFVPALVVLLLQDQIASLVLGTSASAAALPAGLSPELLITFGILFVLGFGLYAVLYAGAAALVSRTEDINSIVAPMTLVSTAGYLVAVYSSTGLISPDSLLVRVMSFIPFFSPYLILTRIGSGTMGPLEIIVAIVLLAISVPIALWFAARLYAAGVLMYGQRPSLRLMFRVLRGA